MLTIGRYASIAMVALLALSHAALAQFKNRDERLKSIGTVGIVSAIGDQFTFAHAGLVGLNNSAQRVSITSWSLDELIVRQVTVALSGRFQVQAVTYNRAAFAAIDESAITAVNLVRGDPVKKLVQTNISPQGLDAYVVITKAKARFGGSNRKVEGLGLITHNAALESYRQIHALYEIRVVDGRTFDIIEKFSAAPLDDASTVRLPGPSRLIDANFDQQDENLRRTIIDLITRSLPNILADMHLIDRRP